MKNSINDKDQRIEFKDNENFKGFSESIESIKALAIIGIIISHLNQFYIILNNKIVSNFFWHLGGIGVNIFIFLSGMLLIITLKKHDLDIKFWRDWYKKRAIRIYPPFILSTLFIILIQFIIFNETYEIDLVLVHISGFQSIPGSPNFFLIMNVHWYITIILTSYLIFPIVYYLLIKNPKIIVFLIIFFYSLYVVFFKSISNYLPLIFYLIFKNNLVQYETFLTRYFMFFFGIIFGFYFKKNEIKSVKILKSKKIGLLSFIFLVIFGIISLNLDLFSISYQYINIFFSPLISVTFIIFIIITFNNKPKINNLLKIPARESYEIFLLHGIIISIILLYPIEAFLFPIYLLITIISSLMLAYPFNRIGEWLKNEKKYHIIIIQISLSLIGYSIISNIILFSNSPQLNNLCSITLYLFILIAIISIDYFWKLNKNKKLRLF